MNLLNFTSKSIQNQNHKLLSIKIYKPKANMQLSLSLKESVPRALNASNKPEQTKAEQTIMNQLYSNPAKFYYEILEIACTQTQSDSMRQSALVVFSRAVEFLNKPNNNNSPNQLQGAAPGLCWDTVDLNSKQAIKNKLLSLLVSPREVVKKSACYAIAAVADLQVVRGEWRNLIANLVSNIDNQDKGFQRTAIMTLGCICEKFKTNPAAVDSLDYELCSSIMAGILKGLIDMGNFETALSSLAALRDSLGFLQKVTADQRVRSHVIQTILNYLQNQNHAYREMAIQALSEFSKFNYAFLEPQIEQILRVTNPIIESHHESLAPALLAFWDEIGQMYVEKAHSVSKSASTFDQFPVKNYMPSVQDLLIKSSLMCLLVTDQEKIHVREGGQRLVSTLCETCNIVVIDPITSFVSNCLVSQDWTYRQASLTAFACLCEYAEKQAIAQLFSRGLDSMIPLLKDANPTVAIYSNEAFSQLLSSFAASFVDHPKYNQHIKILTECLACKEPRVAAAAINCFNSICLHVSSSKGGNFLGWNDLLTTLFHFAFFSQTPDNIILAFLGMTNLFKSCRSSEIAVQYIYQLINRYAQLPRDKKNLDPAQAALVEGIMCVLNSAVLSLRHSVLREEFIRKVYNFTIQHFKCLGDVDSDGLLIVGSLSLVARKGFAKYLTDFWPYLEAGFAKTDITSIFNASLNCMGDLARSLQHLFQPYFEGIMQRCLKLLGDYQKIQRIPRLHIIQFLSDLILVSLSLEVLPHLQDLLMVVEYSFQGVLNLMNSNMEDFEYAEELRGAALQLYEGLNFKCNADNVQPRLLEYFPKFESFIYSTCNPQFKPTVEYVGQCVQVLADLGYMLHIESHMRSSEDFRKLLDLLRKYQKNDIKLREIVDYGDSILHCL